MPTRSTLPEAAPQTASQLRREISARNLQTTHEHETTYGTVPSVVYRETDGTHGNFFPASYKRILANPAWAARLDKTYTASHRIVRGNERARAELDCANSSDALLMNIFCHPRALHSRTLRDLLCLGEGDRPHFGVRVRTPLAGGFDDRTEVDMQIGDLLIEAKLSERDFQTARPDLMARYEDFEQVFDVDRLPRMRGNFGGYQLLRGVLAAHHQHARFAVLCDARRPDLQHIWFSVLSGVNASALRSRLLLLTWQEIAVTVSKPLQVFLRHKYGILPTR